MLETWRLRVWGRVMVSSLVSSTDYPSTVLSDVSSRDTAFMSWRAWLASLTNVPIPAETFINVFSDMMHASVMETGSMTKNADRMWPAWADWKGFAQSADSEAV